MTMIFNALSGALAAQAALNTNSQNIANAATPGYTRQGVLLSSQQSSGRGVNAAGNGVQVSSLLRFSDGFKSQQLWQANSNLGQYNAGQSYLDQLEQVMSDDTANINQGLDAFFAALNAASVQPDSQPLRDQVLTSAGALAKRITAQQQLYTTQHASLIEQRGAAVSQINGYTQDIALLNKQIAAGQSTGINTSGLQDARDQKVDALASLVGIQVVEQNDGTRSVSLRNGQPLVSGSNAAQLSLDSTGTLKLGFSNTTFTVPTTNLGGQLGGLQDYEQQVLTPLQTSVSELAQGIATTFNTQLAAGFTPAGTPGQPLFSYSNGMLGMMPLAASDLAFSSNAAASGDGGNLTLLIGLKSATVNLTAFDTQGNKIPDGLGGFVTKAVVLGDVYTQLVGTLGVQSQQNQAGQTTAQTVRDQAQANWASTSGVNTDEEAINLMQYKQMYDANMKVIGVANDLFDSTLAMIR
ncbi:MAG: flagellar hook-associated protein FlgK [Burkholderiaceae bacterium]